MKKRVCRVGPDGAPEVLAEFSLVGEHVATAWRNDEYRLLVLDRGITGLRSGELCRVRPRDGRAFWDALDQSYAASSTVWIEQG